MKVGHYNVCDGIISDVRRVSDQVLIIRILKNCKFNVSFMMKNHIKTVIS